MSDDFSAGGVSTNRFTRRSLCAGEAVTVSVAVAGVLAGGVAGNLAYDLLKQAVQKARFWFFKPPASAARFGLVSEPMPGRWDQELVDYAAKTAVALRLCEWGNAAHIMVSLRVSSSHATERYASVVTLVSDANDHFEAHVYFPAERIQTEGVTIHFGDRWTANAPTLDPVTPAE
jgi:hypothetical protein